MSRSLENLESRPTNKQLTDRGKAQLTGPLGVVAVNYYHSTILRYGEVEIFRLFLQSCLQLIF
jgi:hypothetical protein